MKRSASTRRHGARNHRLGGAALLKARVRAPQWPDLAFSLPKFPWIDMSPSALFWHDSIQAEPPATGSNKW